MSDGVVAPMLYALLLGAPGALAYKAVNTLDSMVGHPQPPYRDLGWASARLDDLANLLPARLTALSVAACSGRALSTLATVRRYGPLTRSPNAGRVEAAFAGALGLELGGANSYRGVLRQGRAVLVGVASGIALGAHFGFWISSLDYTSVAASVAASVATSVAASVVLVCTQPVFVAILAYLIFGERTSSLSFLGILVALAGTGVIASDGSVGSATFFGNTLAVIGALAVAVYVLIGRSLRITGVGVLPYSVVVYASASAILAPAALYAGVPVWGYSGETWFWLFAVMLGPQILEHTVLNWAVRYVQTSIISGTILAEPVVSGLLAWLVLSERPGFPTLLGGAVVLLGLFLLLRGYRPPRGKTAPPVEPVA